MAGTVPYTVVSYNGRFDRYESIFPITVTNDRYWEQQYRDIVLGNTVKVTIIGVTVIGVTIIENSLFRVSYKGQPL